MNSLRPESSLFAGNWAVGLVTLAGLLISVATFWSTWVSMANIWSNTEDYSHGFFVPVIAFWLLLKNAPHIPAGSRPRVGETIIWCLLTGTVLLLWAIAEVTSVGIAAKAAAIAVIPLIVFLAYGFAYAKQILFPLLFLFFMVPIGSSLTPALMEWTASVTIWALLSSGIPVFRSGLFFELPSGRWSVVEACSGLRYIIAAIVLSSVFAYLNFTAWWKRAMFIAAATIVAVIANWVRAYLIVLLGHFSGMTIGVGDDHVVYGWIFFGATIFFVFWFGGKWRDPPACPRPSSAAPSPLTASGQGGLFRRLTLFGIVFLCLGWLLGSYLDQRGEGTHRGNEYYSAAAANVGLKEAPGWFKPNFSGARWEGYFGNDTARSYIALYSNQKPGFELIQHDNVLILSTGEKGFKKIRGPYFSEESPEKLTVGYVDFEVNGKPATLAYWYTVCGQTTLHPAKVKLLQAWALLTGCHDHAAVSVVYWLKTDNPSQAKLADLINSTAVVSRIITKNL
jgi:exosortase A